MNDIFEDIPLGSHSLEGHIDDGLSMAEYEELRLLLGSAKAAFAMGDEDIVPNPQTQKNLRAMVAARKKTFHWPTMPSFDLSRLVNFRIPAWQASLAMATVLVAAFFIGHNSAGNGNKNAVVIYKTDTVYQNVQRNSSTAISKDSEAQILVPSGENSGPLYSDSIDINSLGNSSASPADQSLPFPKLDANPGKLKSPPGRNGIQNPGEMGKPSKNGSPIEDTSRWAPQLRG